MRVSYLLWAIVLCTLGVIVFSAFFRKKHRYTFDAFCPDKGKVCVLYPDQIEKVIATGKNIVSFFYSPDCDVRNPVTPVLERYCTLSNDTVYCQINCSPKGGAAPASDQNKVATRASPQAAVQHLGG